MKTKSGMTACLRQHSGLLEMSCDISITILMNFQVSHTRKLWLNNYEMLSEYITHIHRKIL